MIKTIQPVSRDTLRERVYAEIRAALMEGKFRPGEPLRLQAVADAVGTSVMPVREALRRLVAERALVSADGRSMFVPFPTEDEFTDILETRLRLEPYATRLAAANMTPRILAELEQIAARMNGAQTLVDYLRANQQFHFAIYGAAHRPFLLSQIESLWLHIGPLLSHLFKHDIGIRPDDRHVTLAAELHEAVLEGLRRGDAEAAGQAIARDLGEVGTTIKDLLHRIDNPQPVANLVRSSLLSLGRATR